MKRGSRRRGLLPPARGLPLRGRRRHSGLCCADAPAWQQAHPAPRPAESSIGLKRPRSFLAGGGWSAKKGVAIISVPPPLCSYNAGIIGHRRVRGGTPPLTPPRGQERGPAGGPVARLPPRREAGRLQRPAPRLRRRLAPWSRNRRGGGKRKTRRGSFPWPRKKKRSLAAPLLSPRFFVSRFTPPEERSGLRPRGAPPRPAAQPRGQRSDRPAVPSPAGVPGTAPAT